MPVAHFANARGSQDQTLVGNVPFPHAEMHSNERTLPDSKLWIHAEFA